MTRRSSRDLFITVRTEGAILPPDLLQRILDLDRTLPGLTSEAFHLASGESFGEATSRAWQRLQGPWATFKAAREKLPQTDSGSTVTRQRWLLPLFQELGYGRLTQTPAVKADGVDFPVFSNWGGRVPIHFVGCGVDLDSRTAGIRGAAKVSPHGLVQDLLNRSDDHLWGFVSNGLLLRVQRDNLSLTRQSFAQFDLEAMFEGGAYSDFALLWMVCHQSRVEAEKPEQCFLEQWSKLAQEEGTRALENLRKGVEESITDLGRGFLAHEGNRELRERLRSGTLSTQDYYRQLLRLVYRLIFLFVAEDRDVLQATDADPQTRDLYQRYYSTKRLRLLASRRRGTRHGDLFVALRLVMDGLGGEKDCLPLALPALGSYLWSREAMSDLYGASLSNEHLLNAVRALALSSEEGALRPVDYKNLGAEELGSVYESLLELHPKLHLEAAEFQLDTAAGNERKTSGSYYTPDSLIQCLLDSALDPILDEAAKKPNPVHAILELKVCDPACGSGHFLIGAAHRIAKRLASVRTGDDEPSPEAVRTALRDVIGRCLYGVDLNPMAVELCKVSLWMEALEPGKPLSFLDHHIRCGNSLLGATPGLLAQGIPDEAFTPIEGDDKALCKELKKRNKKEREAFTRTTLFAADSAAVYESLASRAQQLRNLTDETIEAIRNKEKGYADLEDHPFHARARLLADTWCAAFVMKKTRGAAEFITHDRFIKMGQNSADIPTSALEEVRRLAGQYAFFHWHLRFPEVFRGPLSGEQPDNEEAKWSGGFDVVLGNPPWELTQMQEKEWFAEWRPDIVSANSGAERKRLIEALENSDQPLFAAFISAKREHDGVSYFLGNSGRYPFCGRGRINLYTVFAEGMRSLLNDSGRVGCVLPTGIATDDTTKFFFQDVIEKKSLVCLFDFENKLLIFPAVAPVVKFCLFTSGSGLRPTVKSAQFVFFAHSVDDLSDPDRRFTLSGEDIALLNPNTRTCPIFRGSTDAELTKAIYRRVPVLIREAQVNQPEENPWSINFKQGLFNMTSDSHLFHTREQLEAEGWRLEGNIFRKDGAEYLPLYEAKLFHQFNHRPSTFDGIPEVDRFKMKAPTRASSLHQLGDPCYQGLPRFWVSQSDVWAACRSLSTARWFLVFRGMTNVMTNSRNAIFAVLPRTAVGNSAPLCVLQGNKPAFALLSVLNSFVLDYATRQKLAGGNMNFFIVKQLPVLLPDVYELPCRWSEGSLAVRDWILPRVLELTYTAWDLEPFANDCGWSGSPFRWDEERRFLLRCELDAAFFHLYLPSDTTGDWRKASKARGDLRDETPEELAELKKHFPTPRHAVDYIMDTFPIVKRKDEDLHGEYRTKRVILEIYDAMAEAIRTGKTYQTRLDPPPADPRCCHPPRAGGKP